MAITRQHIIDLCEQFLLNEISKKDVEVSHGKSLHHEIDWDDDLISDILLE